MHRLPSGRVVADFRLDQAAGLRRLFGNGHHLQVITFVAGCEGVGRSQIVANLGVALARLGKEVLIIDENSAADDIASGYGIQGHYDLLHVIEQMVSLPQVLLQPMAGLRVLPAALATHKLGRLSAAQQRTLLSAMSALERPLDFILVDASIAHPGGVTPFAMVSQEVVVTLSGNTQAITEAYALIKKASQIFARKHFRILVNKVRQAGDALPIFDNIARVARQRGVATVEYAGAVPFDEAFRLAGQMCRSVLIQAPDSPSAAACRDIAAEMEFWRGSAESEGGVEHFVQQLLHFSQRLTPELLRA